MGKISILVKGMVIGGGIALLMAPKTGKKFRKELAGKADHNLNKMMDYRETAMDKADHFKMDMMKNGHHGKMCMMKTRTPWQNGYDGKRTPWQRKKLLWKWSLQTLVIPNLIEKSQCSAFRSRIRLSKNSHCKRLSLRGNPFAFVS